MTNEQQKIYRLESEVRTLELRLEKAKSLLQDVADEYYSEASASNYCPVCFTYSHKGWCFMPRLKEFLGIHLNEFDIEALKRERPD